MKESELQDRIRLALGAVPGLALFRNNIGVAEIHGHKIRFGVGGPGGADLIGIFNGRFVAAEIKVPGRYQTPDQKRFQQLITDKGGSYAVLKSVDEAIAWIDQLRSAA